MYPEVVLDGMPFIIYYLPRCIPILLPWRRHGGWSFAILEVATFLRAEWTATTPSTHSTHGPVMTGLDYLR